MVKQLLSLSRFNYGEKRTLSGSYNSVASGTVQFRDAVCQRDGRCVNTRQEVIMKDFAYEADDNSKITVFG